MSIRSDRIKQLIEQSQHSYKELERITGIKKSSLQRYASGVTAKIPLDVIEKLSATFGVSQEYLMGWEEKEKDPNSEVSELESRLLTLFRGVEDGDKEMLLDMIEAALKRKMGK